MHHNIRFCRMYVILKNASNIICTARYRQNRLISLLYVCVYECMSLCSAEKEESLRISSPAHLLSQFDTHSRTQEKGSLITHIHTPTRAQARTHTRTNTIANGACPEEKEEKRETQRDLLSREKEEEEDFEKRLSTQLHFLEGKTGGELASQLQQKPAKQAY